MAQIIFPINVFAIQPLPPEDSKSVIEKIMQREELKNTKKETRWQLKEINKLNDNKKENSFFMAFTEVMETMGRLLAYLLESILWLVVIITIILLIVFRKKWLTIFQSAPIVEKKKTTPEVLFGMDIRPNALPKNIPQQAQALWKNQQYRESLSLLYRGALAELVNRDQIPLDQHHTEGDALKLTGKNIQQKRQQYFEKLTKAWRKIAYAHKIPSDDEVNYLFKQWNNEFIVQKIQEIK